MEPLDIRRSKPAQTNLMEPLRETASQTAGPYVHIGCLPNASSIACVFSSDLTTNHTDKELKGEPITVWGSVFDGDGVACKDIMLEYWHADHEGNFHNGVWGRTITEPQSGQYSFNTIKPGTVSDHNEVNLLPFVSILIFARGINLGLLTRMYFPQHAALLEADPHMALLERSRQTTLFCTQENEPNEYRFDIRLQGDNETVFFDT